MAQPVKARCAKCRQLVGAKQKDKNMDRAYKSIRVYLVKHNRPSIQSPGAWTRCPGSGGRASPLSETTT